MILAPGLGAQRSEIAEGLDKLTLEIPGCSIPITIMASSLEKPDDA